MRGRIPYVIVGYISPTFIKILVDHAISQLGLPFSYCYFFAASFRLVVVSAFYFKYSKKKEGLGTRLAVTTVGRSLDVFTYPSLYQVVGSGGGRRYVFPQFVCYCQWLWLPYRLQTRFSHVRTNLSLVCVVYCLSAC